MSYIKFIEVKFIEVKFIEVKGFDPRPTYTLQ
jgi:hypothetical protein